MLLLVGAIVARPTMRFQAAPEPPQGSYFGMGMGAPSIDNIRALGNEIEDIELTRIERVEGGLIEVDANFTGPNPPVDQPAWNLLAKEIANKLTRSPANTQTVRVDLFHNDTLRSQAVTSRSE